MRAILKETRAGFKNDVSDVVEEDMVERKIIKHQSFKLTELEMRTASSEKTQKCVSLLRRWIYIRTS
jgi:hypothetical protein